MPTDAPPPFEPWTPNLETTRELDDVFGKNADDGDRSIQFETSEGEKPTRFRLLTTAELSALTPPKPIVDGVLFKGGFSAIVAPYDSFKSFAAIDLALCVAHGLDFHGLTTTPGFVVYQAGEGGHGLARRIEAWRVLNGLPEIGNIGWITQPLKLNDPRDLADLLAIIRNQPHAPALIVLDTFARSMRGNENSAEDTGQYIEAVDRIREATGAHVQLIHHAGWEGTRSRGSSNIPASLDTEITLARDGDRVTLTNTKQKDAAPFAELTLEAVEIAGSLAFRRFAPTSASLSDNERATLRAVQESGPLKAKVWAESADIPRRSFFAAKKRLMTLAYVKATADGFVLTDTGRQAR